MIQKIIFVDPIRRYLWNEQFENIMKSEHSEMTLKIDFI